MKRSYKYYWMKGLAIWDYNQDGRFKDPKLQKNDKRHARKRQRKLFKQITIIGDDTSD